MDLGEAGTNMIEMVQVPLPPGEHRRKCGQGMRREKLALASWGPTTPPRHSEPHETDCSNTIDSRTPIRRNTCKRSPLRGKMPQKENPLREAGKRVANNDIGWGEPGTRFQERTENLMEHTVLYACFQSSFRFDLVRFLPLCCHSRVARLMLGRFLGIVRAV